MSLTAFQRYRRMKPVEEMKPENITKETPTLENFTTEPLVPEEIPAEEPLVPEELPEEAEEVNTENKEKTKTANRRKGNK